MAQAKLLRPTSVASVAMNGGSRTTVISQACRLPIKNPMISVPTIAAAMTGNPISTSPPHAIGGQQQQQRCADGAAEANHRAGREIDPAGYDDDRRPEREDPEERRLPQEEGAVGPRTVPVVVLRVEQRGQTDHQQQCQEQSRLVSAQKAQRVAIARGGIDHESYDPLRRYLSSQALKTSSVRNSVLGPNISRLSGDWLLGTTTFRPVS